MGDESGTSNETSFPNYFRPQRLFSWDIFEVMKLQRCVLCYFAVLRGIINMQAGGFLA